MAGIEQIVVRYPKFRAVDLRSKVLNIKLAGHSSPLFAKQTVDATKGKLIAKPWAVGNRTFVALRAMTALMCYGWIIERNHSISCLPAGVSFRGAGARSQNAAMLQYA